MWEPFRQWFLEPANQQLLVGIGIAFLIGLILGRLKGQTKKDKAKTIQSMGDKAFFKGIQYILSNDHNHAIEEFTKSVQVNSDTIETYVALGNLYRSKGDIDRAVRIRQSLILRPNIDDQVRRRAYFDLGLDYRKGGFLNRALDAFLKAAQKDPSNVEILEETEKIHEELKDWENAYRVRQKISRLVKGEHSHILAHQLAEAGKSLLEKGDSTKARSYFNKAVSTHRECVDAYLHLGDLYFDRQDYKKAMATWKKVAEVAPELTFLAYRRLEGAYAKMKNLKPVGDFLKECAQLTSDAFTHLALARYLYNEDDIEGALGELDHALELDPAFWEARKLKGKILLSQKRDPAALSAYENLLDHLNVPYLKFQCTYCGYRSDDLQWQCPQCRHWDTIRLTDAKEVGSTPVSQVEDTLPRIPEKGDGE
jgi:lipopolysaccharide biosynthesis regulator YciM